MKKSLKMFLWAPFCYKEDKALNTDSKTFQALIEASVGDGNHYNNF
jgi:hypothetical protein